MAIPMRSPALWPTWRVPKPATSPARACSPMEAPRREMENGKTRAINKTMKAPRIVITIGSTRPGRKGEPVAKWVCEVAQKPTDADFEVVQRDVRPGHRLGRGIEGAAGELSIPT